MMTIGSVRMSQTWAATETPSASTPEPASSFLLGSGLCGALLLGRYFRR